MKNCLLILIFLISKSALAQLNENFSDGDFTNNPVWNGSNNGIDFSIIPNGNKYQLRSNSTQSSSNFYLSTVNNLATETVWEFWCNLQFNTSSSNFVDVYLISDQENLQNASINGYFIRMGGTDDEISLYRRTGATNTSVKIIDGTNGALNTSNNFCKIRVTRTSANLFILERDLSGIGFDYFSEGSVVDNVILTSSYFGILVQQSTSTFFQKHYFTDFSISPYSPDTTPPLLLSATAIDPFTIKIQYNEPMDSLLAKNTSNYSLDNGIGQPLSVITDGNSGKYKLIFGTELNTGDYVLTVNAVTDKTGNFIVNNTTASFHFDKPYEAQINDVVINEIFADPSPQIDLPGVEFMELWNTTDQPISLDKWTYSDGTTSYTFGNESLLPNELVILCTNTDVANFSSYGKVIGISPWPSLNNSGDQLSLKNANGQVINQVNYTDSWYKDALKKQGGWSLELINPKAYCSGIQNWAASQHIAGGTPAQINSVYLPNVPVEPLKVISAEILDQVTLSVQFNRFVDSTSAANPLHYSLNNGVGQPLTAVAIGPYFQEVRMTFGVAPALGKNYTLSCGSVSDCKGDLLTAPNNSISFYLADQIKKGDLLISEILFNPKTGGVDFVEIYNNSDHDLDLKDLRIASLNEKDSLIAIKSISPTQLLIQSQGYRAISTNSINIQTEYPAAHADKLIEVNSLPAFNDDAGVVLLIRSDSTFIDQFNYTENMHFPLIKNAEGVSLERSSFAIASNEPGNFRSAAASVGFATPGYQNSQFITGQALSEDLSLESTTLSPDNDGFEDALTIHYQFAQAGWVANLRIYSDQGAPVRYLVKNMTLGTKGAFIWDGLNDRSERVPIGVYLIHLQVFDLSGKVKTYIKPCIVATQLN